jgi:hypothetical protein
MSGGMKHDRVISLSAAHARRARSAVKALSRLSSRVGDAVGKLRVRFPSLHPPSGARAFVTSDRLPLALLTGLLVSAVVTVFLQAHNYGVTLDEELQERLGRHLLAWYGTLGSNSSFLTVFPAYEHMPEHGGIYDTVVAAVQYILHLSNPNSSAAVLNRHVLGGLCGVAGVAGIALCGYELARGWTAFLAALGL